MRIGGFVALAYVGLILWGFSWLWDHAKGTEVHCVYAADGIRTICGESAD